MLFDLDLFESIKYIGLFQTGQFNQQQMFQTHAKGDVQGIPESTASDEFILNFMSVVTGSVWSGEPKTGVSVEFSTDFETNCVGTVWDGEPRGTVSDSFKLDFQTQVTAELQEE